MNYGSEDSFHVLNTQPNRSLRDLLKSITSYEALDPSRIPVTEIAESDIESVDLVDPNAVTSSSFWLIQIQSLLLRHQTMNGTSTAKQLKTQHRSQKDAKQTKKL